MPTTSKSSITIDWVDGLYRKTPKVHPGVILNNEFLLPAGISQYRLAVSVGVPPRRINEIVLGKRGISADTALRLGRFFGTTVNLWLNMQMTYEVAAAVDALGTRLHREVTPWTKLPKDRKPRIVARRRQVAAAKSNAR